MLELEVGIWSFEGCVSFLGFPRPANPLAPKTENPPRRQSDHAVCMWRSSRCQMMKKRIEGIIVGPISARERRVGAENGGPNPSGSVASSTARAR